MSIETPQDRAALARIEGSELVTSAGDRIFGWFDTPTAEELLVEGVAPTFGALESDLARASVTIGTTDLTVERHDGTTLGPYRVVNIPEREDDGLFITLGLELQ